MLSRPQHEFFRCASARQTTLACCEHSHQHRSGRPGVRRDPHNRYLQADLDGHQYNRITRSAVSQILHLSQNIECAYGYVVESRKEAEMPEVMTCCCRIFKFNLDEAVPFPPLAKA